MKQLSLILNGVLIIAVGVLYFLHFSAGNKQSPSTAQAVNANAEGVKVAYINMDSILLKYNLSVELNEALLGKKENMRSKLEKDMKDFEKEAQLFQDKLQRGIFLNQQRAEEAQQKLVMRQKELQNLEMDYTNQLAQDQGRMNTQLFDSVTNFINSYNADQKFDIILGHQLGGNMLYGADQLDITQDILKGLNEAYTNKK
jgi:outer membrane protein